MLTFKDLLNFLQMIISWIPRIIGYYLLFLAIALIVPPLFKAAMPENWLERDRELAAAPMSDRERVMSIDDIHDAEFWRYRLLTQAEETVDMAIFSYRDDMGGITFTSALMDAADRGVKVRLLVDGINLKTVGSEYFSLIDNHPNIEVRIYNPIRFFKPWTFNYRLHDKFIVVDDQVYMLGGRNQNSLFIGDYDDEPKKNQDRDLIVYEGDKHTRNSLMQVEDYFEEIWNLDKVKKVKPLSKDREKDLKQYRDFEERTGELQRQLKEKMPDAFRETDWVAETLPSRRVELIRGSGKAGNKPPLVYRRLLERMKKGKDIIVETPYIILNKGHYEDFSDLNEAYGAHVSYLTNSPEYGANIVGNAEELFNRKAILRTGSDLYEYMGAQSQHTKTILIDDEISLVGTFNYDMRSIYLDTESMLCVDSPELNAELREQMREKMDASRQVLPGGEMEYGPDARKESLSTPKSVFLKGVHFLTYPFRHLL
ncbi:MAG: phospholipase D-like domain-containing protein [Firmicutes bacterium]|nr:phospholipase D-like domain-containing protein [Bacillota bacterium]